MCCGSFGISSIVLNTCFSKELLSVSPASADTDSGRQNGHVLTNTIDQTLAQVPHLPSADALVLLVEACSRLVNFKGGRMDSWPSASYALKACAF
eukprot:1909096-Amphidinium_carterae.1